MRVLYALTHLAFAYGFSTSLRRNAKWAPTRNSQKTTCVVFGGGASAALPMSSKASESSTTRTIYPVFDKKKFIRKMKNLIRFTGLRLGFLQHDDYYTSSWMRSWNSNPNKFESIVKSLLKANFPACISGTVPITTEIAFQIASQNTTSDLIWSNVSFSDIDSLLLLVQDSKYNKSVEFVSVISAERIKIENESFLKRNAWDDWGWKEHYPAEPTHDPTSFLGTVLVNIPSNYTGHGDNVYDGCGYSYSKSVDFATNSNNKESLQYAAFVGGCTYETGSVHSGHRVTLSFSILKMKKKKITKNVIAQNSIATDSINQNDATILQLKKHINTSFHQIIKYIQKNFTLDQNYEENSRGLKDKYVGFILQHAYTHSALSPDDLKGIDKLLYEYLTIDHNNLEVSLLPVVTCLKYDKPVFLDAYSNDHRFWYGHDELHLPSAEVRLIAGIHDNRTYDQQVC